MTVARLIVDPPARGTWNMAVDEALLHSCGHTGSRCLRIYAWAAPTLSLGYFQAYADRQSHRASQDCAVVRRATGGGARSAFWRHMQADVYGQAVHTINASEGPAYGAALLAGVGTGVWSTVPEASAAVVRLKSTTKPDRRNRAAYDRRYGQFQSLYASLKDDFAAIAALEGAL